MKLPPDDPSTRCLDPLPRRPWEQLSDPAPEEEEGFERKEDVDGRVVHVAGSWKIFSSGKELPGA